MKFLSVFSYIQSTERSSSVLFPLYFSFKKCLTQQKIRKFFISHESTFSFSTFIFLILPLDEKKEGGAFFYFQKRILFLKALFSEIR